MTRANFQNLSKIASGVLFTIFFLSNTHLSIAQELSQSISGSVKDSDSKEPLIGATITIVGSNPIKGTSTDLNGNFKVDEVSVGRISINVTYIGYESITIPNIVVTSGKETVLNLSLQESTLNLDEVVITANENRSEPLNEMALLSARSISTEEMARLTASFNDPALITTSFAGAASSGDGGNDIIVRGNSPKYMQWRLEGLPMTNPNHFADQNSVSGTTSALNTNILATSDFYTGAFTSEYGNALSGVYDLRLRNGNNQKHEFILGAGLLGTDLTAEGPLSKDYNGSYLVNYRYSTATALGDLGLIEVEGDPVFQDGAFKLNLPTEKYGHFSIFGLGAMSEFKQPNVDPQDWTTPGVGGLDSLVIEDYEKRSYLANAGLSHFYSFENSNYLETRIGLSIDGVEDNITQESPSFERRNSFLGDLRNTTYHTQLDYHQKLNSKNKFQIGTYYAHTSTKNSQTVQDASDLTPRNTIDFDEGIAMLRNYISWKYRPNEKLTVIGGLHNSNVLYNNKHTLEPRLSASWKHTDRSTISIGYGLHSSMEKVHHYFAELPDANDKLYRPNEDLDLLKAHHFVASYTHNISNDWQAKLEVYYQHLYNLPVAADSTYYATINEDLEFEYIDLVNEGSGENYGIELTLQKFFSKNYYFMINGTWFQSNYTALDGIQRNTRFEGDYLINILGGKEYTGLGKKKNKTLAINSRLFLGGGKKILSVKRDDQGNADVNLDNGDIFNTEIAYKNSLEDIYNLSLSVSYKWEKLKTTNELILNIDNITDNKGKLSEYYSPSEANGIGHTTQFGMLPNLMYRLYF